MSTPPPPPGCRWEWRPETEATGLRWRTATGDEIARWRRGEIAGCRWTVGPGKTQCHARPRAALNRAVGRGRAPLWWLYCGRHLYGRRIRGGVVEHRVAVPRDE